VRKLLATLLMAISCAAQAEVRVFEQAERAITPNWWGAYPKDHSAWSPISLPHNLYKDPTGSYTWYRVRFHIDHDPARSVGQSLYFPKLRLSHVTVYVNRQAIWQLREAYAEGVSVSALQILIPPGLLRAGENVIDLETSGYSRWYHSLSRLYFGDTATLSKRAAIRNLLQDKIRYIVAAAFGAIGILSLWLWFQAGREPVLFWYGVSGVTLLVATAAWYVSQWQTDSGWRLAMIFMRYHGYLVPFFILHLRLAGRRHYWLEAALWLALAAAFFNISNLFQSTPRSASAWVGWGLAFSALPALLAVTLLASPRLRTRPSVMLLVVADVAACLLPLHDWGWRFGILDSDRPFLVFYAPAFVMLAAMAPILERVRANMHAREQNRLELERRVAEKTREIEASHEQLRQAQREQALAEERRRIMADMHDGLGAKLVALLSIAQSGKAQHGEISEGIASALDELRLTVDSAQPVEGDVGVVLGNVRHRMRSVFERAGIRFAWNVSALPRMESLTPERILAIQRIFLEVFSNAIRHSGARKVSVFTMRVPGAVRIVIEDDGRGFDPGAGHAGRGLGNLQMRAVQAGGTLKIESQAGKGTRVTLSLPFDGEDTPEPLPDTGQKPEEYPVRGMAADPTTA
jgi:signal transduction histidine kinase